MTYLQGTILRRHFYFKLCWQAISIKFKLVSYPIQKAGKLILTLVTNIVLPTNNFQSQNFKTVNICLVGQISPHCIFWCHVSTAHWFLVQNMQKLKRIINSTENALEYEVKVRCAEKSGLHCSSNSSADMGFLLFIKLSQPKV